MKVRLLSLMRSSLFLRYSVNAVISLVLFSNSSWREGGSEGGREGGRETEREKGNECSNESSTWEMRTTYRVPAERHTPNRGSPWRPWTWSCGPPAQTWSGTSSYPSWWPGRGNKEHSSTHTVAITCTAHRENWLDTCTCTLRIHVTFEVEFLQTQSSEDMCAAHIIQVYRHCTTDKEKVMWDENLRSKPQNCISHTWEISNHTQQLLRICIMLCWIYHSQFLSMLVR